MQQGIAPDEIWGGYIKALDEQASFLDKLGKTPIIENGFH
jgi:hypothetical protein